MIAVVDYGVGNLYSLSASLTALGLEHMITGEVAALARADKIILPGVGAFGDAMARLRQNHLSDAVTAHAQQGKPLLGICLGMQLLCQRSLEYGEHQGLGLLPGSIEPLTRDLRAGGFPHKVPHMGWNSLRLHQPDHPMARAVHEGESVYFVHSYYAVDCGDALVSTAEHGLSIPAMLARKNVWACQFHPEKSGGVGLRILAAFGQL